MFYSIRMKYEEEDDDKIHFSCGLVYAKDKQEAMKKAMCLYSGYNICFIEVSDLPDEFMEKMTIKFISAADSYMPKTSKRL